MLNNIKQNKKNSKKTKETKETVDNECIVCFYNILQDESYCYCDKCKVHSHLSCLDNWNENYSGYDSDVCCHCRQSGHLVKEIVPKCSCFGWDFFIKKKQR